jgi:hypothetical protein
MHIQDRGPAGWAERPEMQQAFSDIRKTVDGRWSIEDMRGCGIATE